MGKKSFPSIRQGSLRDNQSSVRMEGSTAANRNRRDVADFKQMLLGPTAKGSILPKEPNQQSRERKHLRGLPKRGKISGR